MTFLRHTFRAEKPCQDGGGTSRTRVKRADFRYIIRERTIWRNFSNKIFRHMVLFVDKDLENQRSELLYYPHRAVGEAGLIHS